jgi:hypothetical protein
MVSERGQATIEWTGLALLVALVLGSLAALAPRLDGRGLGATVAHAITCAARGGCTGESAPAGAAPGSRSARRVHGAAAAPRPARPRAPAAPPSPAPRAPIPAERAPPASQALRRIHQVGRRVWIFCVGYRRYVYERDHPRISLEGIPVEEALDIANECINPLGFLSDD